MSGAEQAGGFRGRTVEGGAGFGGEGGAVAGEAAQGARFAQNGGEGGAVHGSGGADQSQLDGGVVLQRIDHGGGGEVGQAGDSLAEDAGAAAAERVHGVVGRQAAGALELVDQVGVGVRDLRMGRLGGQVEAGGQGLGQVGAKIGVQTSGGCGREVGTAREGVAQRGVGGRGFDQRVEECGGQGRAAGQGRQGVRAGSGGQLQQSGLRQRGRAGQLGLDVQLRVEGELEHQGFGRPGRGGQAAAELAADGGVCVARKGGEQGLKQGGGPRPSAEVFRGQDAGRGEQQPVAFVGGQGEGPAADGDHVLQVGTEEVGHGSGVEHGRVLSKPFARGEGDGMSERYLLALDQGTTSTRAVLFGADGRERATASRPLAQSYPADGWVEHDPEAIFNGSVAVLREALAGEDRPVAGLGIANQRETAVVWDRATGRAIAPAIVWQDRRTAEACERLKRDGLEPEIARKSGLRLDPYFSATKWAWLLDRTEGAREAAGAGRLLCGTVDSWLVWRLTEGRVHATDATNASRTLLFDLEQGRWAPELCRLFGVPQPMLPEVRDTAGDHGWTELLGGRVAIRGVAGDQQAALMGQGCVGAGGLKATFGTGAFVLLHTGEQVVRSGAGLLSSVAARVGGRTTFCLEGSVFSAGSAVQWAGELLGVDGPGAVERLAAGARRDHGVVLAPAFTGLGAPWWDSEARGALVGLTRDSGRAEVAAAAIDSAAHQMGDLLDAMRRDLPGMGALRIDGGMAGSRGFAQRLADLTGVVVERADYQEATALGAALFAGVGAGLWDMEAAARLRPEAERFEPRLADEARVSLRARWLEAVGRVVGRAGRA